MGRYSDSGINMGTDMGMGGGGAHVVVGETKMEDGGGDLRSH